MLNLTQFSLEQLFEGMEAAELANDEERAESFRLEIDSRISFQTLEIV